MPAIRGAALPLITFLSHVAGFILLGPAGPAGLTILSAAVLAAVLTGLVAVTIAAGARIARTITAAPFAGPRLGPAGEVLVGGVPPAVRPRRCGPAPAPRAFGRLGGLIPRRVGVGWLNASFSRAPASCLITARSDRGHAPAFN